MEIQEVRNEGRKLRFSLFSIYFDHIGPLSRYILAIPQNIKRVVNFQWFIRSNMVDIFVSKCENDERAIMEKLNDPKLFEADFTYTEQLATENAKNYQIWHHRQWLVTITKDPSRELQFTADLINLDSKNYHAWSYRQWVVKTFNFFDKELAYLDELLAQDLRNNSAWNMRHFVFTHAPHCTSLENEISVAWHWISKSPNNQSPWNYLKGLFAKRNYSDHPDVESKCTEALTKYPVCPNPYFLLIDILERKNTAEALQLAQTYCDKLAANLDTVHKKFWLFRKSDLAKKILALAKQ